MWNRTLTYNTVSFAALAVFALYGVLARPILFNDEVINTARTALPTQLAANYFDYSLRPLYRAFNQIATLLFGLRVSSLWLATSFTLLLAAATLVWAAKGVLGSFAQALIPLTVLGFPLASQVGFGGMPHGLSSIFPALALIPLTTAVVGYLKEEKLQYRAVALASFLAVVGMLWHPIQVASLGAIVGALCLVVAIKVAVGEDRLRNAKGGALLVGCSVGTVALSIMLVDAIYRITVGDARTGRLPDGWSYSYLNLWVGNTGSFDGILAAYAKPFGFYFSTLVSSYLPVVIFFCLLATFATGLFGWRLVNDRSRLWEIVFFIPAGMVVVWLLVNSFVPMKLAYVLVGLLLVVPLALAFLVEYITRAFRMPRGVEVALFVLIAFALVHLGLEQVRARQTLAERPRVVELDYRFVASIPEREVVLATERSPVGSRLIRYCSYYAFAGGKSVERVKDTSDLGVSLAARERPTAVCTYSDAPYRDQLTSAGFSIVYHNKKNNIEIWANR